MHEIESSISFVSVEFVVCTALLLFNTSSLMRAPLTGLALFGAFVAFLIGGLVFAAASGAVVRGPKGLDAARAAQEWGNILTEWFGLYLVLLALPAVVQLATGRLFAGAVATGLTAAGYLVYVASGYDILGRFARGPVRAMAHLVFVSLLGLHWWGLAAGSELLTYAAGGTYIALAAACAIWHWIRGEFS